MLFDSEDGIYYLIGAIAYARLALADQFRTYCFFGATLLLQLNDGVLASC